MNKGNGFTMLVNKKGELTGSPFLLACTNQN